jgi:hypothetical protein
MMGNLMTHPFNQDKVFILTPGVKWLLITKDYKVFATHAETQEKKFLKTIYAIQKSFGSHFGNISRNFSFGIKPNEKERIKLETWFTQVTEAKEQLYKQIHEDYKLKTNSYLGASFNCTSRFLRPK